MATPASPAAAPAAPTAVSPSAGAAPSAPASTGAPGGVPGPSGAAPGAPATQAQRVAWKRAEVMAALEAAGEGSEDVDVYPLIKGYKHKTKVDGQETEVPFDEMIRSAGLSRKARQEITKVRELEAKHASDRKALESIAQRMLDPRQAEPILVKNWGGEEAVEAWARDFLARRDNYKALSPQQRDEMDRMTRSQREAAQRERGLAEREQRIKSEEARIAKGKRDAFVARAGREWPAQFATLGLPTGEPRLVKEAMNATLRLLDNANRNRIPMTVGEAQREAVEGVLSRARALFGGLNADTLRSIVGEEGLASVSAANLSRVANQPGRSTPGDVPRNGDGKFQSKRVIRMSDFD